MPDINSKKNDLPILAVDKFNKPPIKPFTNSFLYSYASKNLIPQSGPPPNIPETFTFSSEYTSITILSLYNLFELIYGILISNFLLSYNILVLSFLSGLLSLVSTLNKFEVFQFNVNFTSFTISSLLFITEKCVIYIEPTLWGPKFICISSLILLSIATKEISFSLDTIISFGLFLPDHLAMKKPNKLDNKANMATTYVAITWSLRKSNNSIEPSIILISISQEKSNFNKVIVSKSLLIVLGTLPLPALNGRGKSIHHPINSLKNRPISCFHNPIFNGAGRAGGDRPPPLPSLLLLTLFFC